MSHLLPLSLIIDVKRGPALRPSVPTTLQPGRLDWQNVVHGLAHDAQLYVGLLLLDRGPASATVRKQITTRWPDVDRALGEDFALLVPAQPSGDWLRPIEDTLRRLDPSVQRVVEVEGQSLQQPMDNERVAQQLDALLAEWGVRDVALPAIAFFEVDAKDPRPEGVLVSFAGSDLMEVVQTLGELAHQARGGNRDIQWIQEQFQRNQRLQTAWRALLSLGDIFKRLKSVPGGDAV